MMNEKTLRRSQSTRRKFSRVSRGVDVVMGAWSWPELIESFNIGGCAICRTLNIVISSVKRDLVISVHVTCIMSYENIYLFGRQRLQLLALLIATNISCLDLFSKHVDICIKSGALARFIHAFSSSCQL